MPSSNFFIPEDVLIEILLRLPLISLYLFKTVSKHWSSIITSPSFTLRLRNQPLRKIDPVCGLFLQKRDSSVVFAPLDDRITASPFGSIITQAGRRFSISDSCNGLLLCKNIHTLMECLVYNPYTNIFKSIRLPPELRPSNYDMDNIKFKLAFDPTKSSHYKVVCFTGGDSCHIPTYSSKTGKWSITGIHFSASHFWGFETGVYWNKAIHWLCKDISRNEQPWHMVLVIEPRPWINACIKTPDIAGVSNAHTLFESRGYLLLLVRSYNTNYNVFEMRDEYFGWSMKYSVYLDDIDPRVQMLSSFCVILGEREEDSFMVVEVLGNVLQYKFVSKTVSTLCNSLSWSSARSFPFVPSLASV